MQSYQFPATRFAQRRKWCATGALLVCSTLLFLQNSAIAADPIFEALERIHAPGAARADLELPEEWRTVAEIRAAQSGQPVAEMLDEVRQAVQQARARPSSEQEGDASILGAPAPIIRVGNDIGGCDFLATSGNNGLQQAMDAAATDANGADVTEIRVSMSGDYTGRRYFLNDTAGGDQSVMIVGGYEFCNSTSPAGITTLDATGATSGPVILIDQVAVGESVVLENLRLQNGNGTNGGGLEIRNNNFVAGTNLSLLSNSATNGGGVHVLDIVDAEPTVLWLLDGSAVSGGNTASGNGGGIYCSGNGASVALDAVVSISSNTAVNGGGFYATSGCSFTSFASFPGGIFANVAATDGGGGYVAGGAEFSLIGGTGGFGFGDATSRTTIDTNIANRSGGGLFVINLGSSVAARDSWIVANRADGDDDDSGSGGGIALNAGTSLTMDRTLGGDACHTADRCSRLADNFAQSGGGVSAAGNGVNVDIRQSWIEGNNADSVASAVGINNRAGDPMQPGTLFMEGNVIVNNPTSSTDLGGLQGVVDVQSNTDTTIAFTTFADNLQNSDGRDLIAFNDLNLGVFSSIFRESTGQVYFGNWDADTQGVIDCAIVHETGSLPPANTAISTADPQFISPGPNGDYHLAGTSPAVDFCDTLGYTPQESDIDGEARGFDVAGNANNLGLYDLGADEFVGTLDGGTVQFETGIAEVMEDAGSVSLTITRTGSAEGTASFRVQTVSDTATSGSDFTALNEVLSWSDGDSGSRTVSVPIIDDSSAEAGRERFRLTLSKESGAGDPGTPNTVNVTIFDNETGMFADGFEGIP